jgi:hypothetical protein
MNIALSFVGKLPDYTVYCIHQIRIFYQGDIYLIIDDLNSPYLDLINIYNVHIINYDDVIHKEFNETVENNRRKFMIVHGLTGREQLFVRSFERFFILYNLMIQRNLENCFFMEIDNLIYDDPNRWLEEFSKNRLCYMFNNPDHCSSGIMYIKNSAALLAFIDYLIYFIKTSNEFMSEMTCLARYYELNKTIVQLLPVFWNKTGVHEYACSSYDKYNNTIFDAASIGIYLLGTEPFHTGGVVLFNQKNAFSCNDYTTDPIELKIEENGIRRPYILKDDQWILINNLHAHSKLLKGGLSLPIDLPI